MSLVGENLAAIRGRMAQACARSGRDPGSVRLLAVSKSVAAPVIHEAWESGQREFGESRQQEASPKVAELPDAIRWHFIGKLQRNKVRKVLADFQVIHSIDSLRLAEQVDRVAGELELRPEVYLEVNLAGEQSKGGFRSESLGCEMPALASLESLRIEGLMAIPPDEDDPEAMRPWFVRLRELRDELAAATDVSLPGLSMGMSGDFEVAIEEGATLVRVGSAIFGERSVVG